MSSRTGKAAFVGILGLLLAGGVGVTPALGQLDAEGIFGNIVDHEGTPLASVQVTLRAFDSTAVRPQVVKTSKKGRYIFPLIRTLEQGGWTVEPVLEGFRPYTFTIKVRDGQKVLIQDDEGGFNREPTTIAIRHRGVGFAEVDIVMVPDGWAPGATESPEGGDTANAASLSMPSLESAPAAPQPTARDRVANALTDGDVGLALTACEEALTEMPEDGDLRFACAKTYRFDGDDPTALGHLSRLARLEPERPGVQVLMGEIQMGLARAAQAQAAFAAERALVGDQPEILKKLAEAAAENGDDVTAMEAYQAWAAVAPDDPRAMLALGTAQARAGDFAASEETFRRAASLDPEGADAFFFNIGVSILNRKPVTGEGRRQAVAAFEQAIQANDKHTGAHFQLGRTLVQLGQIPAAKEHLQRYLDLGGKGDDADLARELLKSL